MTGSATSERQRGGPQDRPASGWHARLERGGATLGTRVVEGAAGRLVLATSGADTPEVAAGAGRGVVFWGDLDNADELRREYGVAGAGPDQPADFAATVLEVFSRHGAALPTKLKGRHVVVAYDAGDDLLLAARDRVGLVPLYYREADEALEFAVSVGAFGDSGAAPQMSGELAAAYLAHVQPELDETFLDGVKRVPPGHRLVVEGRSRYQERHWLPPPVGAGADWVAPTELPRFGELLDAAVARPLSRGRGGIFLSGGLDSVSVAAAAVDYSRRHVQEPPVALSLLFPQAVSEEHVQRGVARTLGVELVSLSFDEALGERGLLRRGIDLSASLAAPLQNVWTPAYDILTRAGRERGITNVLTGGGGDEWLTVTPLIAADYLARGDLKGLFGYLGALGRSLNIPKHQLWRSVLWNNGARPLLYGAAARTRVRYRPDEARRRRQRALAARLAALPAWVAPDAELRGRLIARVQDRYAAPREAPSSDPGGHYFREMKVSLNHPLFALDVEEIFEDGQRNGTPHWDIYWDADLIEFLYRVPPQLLNQGGRSKGLVRAEVAKRFPEFGFATQKKLVSRDFFVERFFAELGPALAELGSFDALATAGVVDGVRARAVVDEALGVRSATHVDRIWRLMSLEAWARTHAC